MDTIINQIFQNLLENYSKFNWRYVYSDDFMAKNAKIEKDELQSITSKGHIVGIYHYKDGQTEYYQLSAYNNRNYYIGDMRYEINLISGARTGNKEIYNLYTNILNIIVQVEEDELLGFFNNEKIEMINS